MNLFSSYSDDEDDIDHDHSDHDPDQHIPRQRRRRESLFRDAMASNESYQHSRDALPGPSAAAADNAAEQSRRPDRPRPGVKRHSSLPQTLFASGSASIFGSGRSPSMEGDQSPPSFPPNQAESVNSSRNPPSEANPVPEASSIPRLSVSHPSQEQLPVSRPPLSAIGGRNRLPSTTRRAHFEDEVRSTADRRIIPNVEKDADDPTNPPATSSTHGRHRSNTLTTLSRLFAVRASTSPDASRQGSYLQQHPSAHHYGTSLSDRNLQTTSIQLGDLPDHLFTRGLLEGRHSDITVIAFNHPYHLHRLILDRAPFFTSALSAPWLESAAKEITVHPSDLDANITQTAFELALKRLYGCSDPVEEEPEAIGLFAVGCWLEMKDLIDSAIESILRQMSPETLSPLIRLVTMNYYGRAGEKILASAKAMLCRDGSSMPLRFWSGIPADIVREMVGGDGFYIEGELERWVLTKRILDRRLKVRAYEAGLTVSSSSSSSSGLTGRSSTRRRRVIKKVPLEYWPRLTAVRFDSISTTSLFSPPVRRGPRLSSASSHANPPFFGGSGGLGVGGAPDALHAFISLYTHPDIEPLLVLLDEGIHYIHLDFESLQFIRGQRDILGFPVMPEKVVNDALWMQMELRQKVINAAEGGLELGLSLKWTKEEEEVHDETIATGHANNDGTPTKGKEKASEYPPPPSPSGHHTSSSSSSPSPRTSQISSGSWDSNGLPRKFWIPASDCNIVMGGNADPVIATSNTTTLQRHAQQQQQHHHQYHQGRYSLALDPRDVQWASDFGAATAQPLGPSSRGQGSRNGAGSTSAAGRGPGGPSPTATTATTNPVDPSPPAPTQTYSHFPPFRFVAEFPPPRLLKERKRIYSQTVFYAGSLWNLYVQKVSTGGSRNSNAGASGTGGSGGKQLGVYLHRAKERGDGDGSGAGSAASGGSSGRPSLDEQRNLRASVDERIGVLEREMRIRREREREVLGLGPDGRRRRRSRRGVVGGGGGPARADLEAGGQGRASPASITTTGGSCVGGGSGGGSLARQENPGSHTRPSSSSAAAGPSIGNETASTPEQDSIRAAYPSGSSEETMFTPASVESEWDSPDDDFGDEFDADDADLRDLEDFLDDDDDDSDYDEALDLDEYGTFVPGPGRDGGGGGGGGQYPAPPPTSSTSPHHPHLSSLPPSSHHHPPHPHPPSTIPALPPYIDVRPTIKTYFKIFSPSRAGRMLSLYESAPDKFNFSQSWGWKSSTLMLDEGIFGGGAPLLPSSSAAGGGVGVGGGQEEEDPQHSLGSMEGGEGAGAGGMAATGLGGDEFEDGGVGAGAPRPPAAVGALDAFAGVVGGGGAGGGGEGSATSAAGMHGRDPVGRRGGRGAGSGQSANEDPAFAFASTSQASAAAAAASGHAFPRFNGIGGLGGSGDSGSSRRRTSTMMGSTTTSSSAGARGKGDGKLRFMVVIGNI